MRTSIIVCLLCSILWCEFQEAESAWQVRSSFSSRSRHSTSPRNTRKRCVSSQSTVRSLELKESASSENEEVSEEDPSQVLGKRMVEVTSQLELPFSVEVAYDAYSALDRHPTWSSWLNSVEYLDEEKQKSKWVIKVMGLSYSWTAEAVKYERPHTIQWKSTSGLKNFGKVKLSSKDDGKTSVMDMTISFVTPRAVSALFNRSDRLTTVVRDKVVASSLLEFRDIVLQNDLSQDE